MQTPPLWPTFRPRLSGALVAAACAAAHAEGEINTDRPDFVESSITVGKGRFQIETSIEFERDRSGGPLQQTRTTPTLLRFGVADDWELRFETDGRVHTRVDDPSSGGAVFDRGWSDISLGLKQHVSSGDEGSGRPSMGWLVHADLATGSDGFKGHGVRPSLRAVFEWDTPTPYSFGIMPGLIYDSTDAGKRFLGGILAVVADRQWTEGFRTFVELAGQRIAQKKYGGSIITYDVGAAWLLTDTMQLDTAFNWGANARSPDFAWTVGFSVKF
jgi:hypothetical protein